MACANDFDEFIADENSNYDSDENTDIDENIDPDLLNDTWTWERSNFAPNRIIYTGNPRQKIGKPQMRELDFFEHFFDDCLIDLIVNETNNYQQQNPIGRREKMADLVDVTSAELWIFFGVFLLTGLLRKNEIEQYWSTDFLISTPIFSTVMPRNRFRDIMRCLHFNDNSIHLDDRLTKINNVVVYLKEKFNNCIVPFQNLCIDESLLLYKGRLSFKEFIPSKRNGFGVRIVMLVDCTARVFLDFIIYTGSSTHVRIVRELGISGFIVMNLMHNYLRKGHTLFVDNWYTSPKLFDLLHTYGTNACGTVRKNRIGLPTLNSKLQRGEIENSHNRIFFFNVKEVFCRT